MSDFTTLILMRHGEVDVRYHKIFGGTIDMDLSPRGVGQAQDLGEYLRLTKLDMLFCSPMKRARQTAAPLTMMEQPEPTIIDDLREIDFGEWTGKTWMRVRDEYQINVFTWLDELMAGRVKDAENSERFFGRMRASLDQILADAKGKTIGVVCHGGVVRGLLSLLLDIPVSHFGKIDIEYASLTKVELHDHKHEATLMNFTPWRDL